MKFQSQHCTILVSIIVKSSLCLINISLSLTLHILGSDWLLHCGRWTRILPSNVTTFIMQLKRPKENTNKYSSKILFLRVHSLNSLFRRQRAEGAADGDGFTWHRYTLNTKSFDAHLNFFKGNGLLFCRAIFICFLHLN